MGEPGKRSQFGKVTQSPVGKMTQDKWGPTMPVHASRSPQFPTFGNVLTVNVFYETDHTALEILPDCCELPEHPLAVMTIAEYQYPRYYTELKQAIAVKINGKPYFFCTHFYVGPGDNALLGNDLEGRPKKIAKIAVNIANEQCYGIVERPPGVTLCTVQFAQTEPVANPEVMAQYSWGPVASLKVVPSPSYFVDKKYEIAEVCASGGDGALTMKIHDFLGKPGVFPGKGSITFNTQSEMDPLHKVPVKKYLKAFMYYVDFVVGDKGYDIVYQYPTVKR